MIMSSQLHLKIWTISYISETAVEWLNQNKVIVNPDKFQAMLLKKKNEINYVLRSIIRQLKQQTVSNYWEQIMKVS